MNTRTSAAIGLASGIIITALYFQFAHPAVAPIQPGTQDCPTQSTQEKTECEPKALAVHLSHDLLPPPKYRADSPTVFVTNSEGEAHVTWNSVPGAKNYRLFLVNETGKAIKSYSTSHTSLYLKDIPMPDGNATAKYSVHLVSLNADDKAGAKGESRVLQIGHQSPVVAPTIKKITVED